MRIRDCKEIWMAEKMCGSTHHFANQQSELFENTKDSFRATWQGQQFNFAYFFNFTFST